MIQGDCKCCIVADFDMKGFKYDYCMTKLTVKSFIPGSKMMCCDHELLILGLGALGCSSDLLWALVRGLRMGLGSRMRPRRFLANVYILSPSKFSNSSCWLAIGIV